METHSVDAPCFSDWLGEENNVLLAGACQECCRYNPCQQRYVLELQDRTLKSSTASGLSKWKSISGESSSEILLEFINSTGKTIISNQQLAFSTSPVRFFGISRLFVGDIFPLPRHPKPKAYFAYTLKRVTSLITRSLSPMRMSQYSGSRTSRSLMSSVTGQSPALPPNLRPMSERCNGR